MNAGDVVKFKEGLYEDEAGAEYRILELRGDRALIEYICDSLPIPPTSVAMVSDLELV